jgi:hypothetical protein
MLYVANYMISTTFTIPKEIDYLLSATENDNADSVVGSWWVKWDRFHYIDKEGNTQIIDGDCDDDKKYPSSVEVDE